MKNQVKTFSFPAKKLKACSRRHLPEEDHISQLPNELIIYILSLLTTKEAGQTSVLSKRWKYVWAHIVVLNFDASDTIYKLLAKETSLEVEKPRYLNWVNQVVGSYRGPAIDEFRVRFQLTHADRDSIDNWVNFAIEKRVKRLEFNFSRTMGGVDSGRYNFRNLLSVCNSLTSLQLVFADVHGDILQILLKNCVALEYLSVKHSNSLVSLEVTEETPNLKYFEVYSCLWVKHIDINAPNLVSFKYSGPEINFPFTRTPKLTQLFIGGVYCNYVVRNLLRFSSYLCQLETLTLHMTFRPEMLLKSFDQFPVCTKLKQLEVVTNPVDGIPLCFIPIIKACPILHKFGLKLLDYVSYKKRKLLEVEAYPHNHLKIIEVCGFIGYAPDIEFAMYLAKSCVALEKIIIDPRRPQHLGTPWEFVPEKKIKRAREYAEKLGPFLKPGVDLVIF